MIKFVPPPNRILRNSVFGFLAALLLIIPLELSAREITARSVTLPSHPLTLHDCIAIALGESPKLEATHFDLLAAGEEIRAAQASLWPNLTGSATGEAFSGERTSKFGIVNAGTTGTGISPTKTVSLAGVGIFGLKLEYPLLRMGVFLDSTMRRPSRLKKRKEMRSPGRLILLARTSSIDSRKSSSTPFQRRTARSRPTVE